MPAKPKRAAEVAIGKGRCPPERLAIRDEVSASLFGRSSTTRHSASLHQVRCRVGLALWGRKLFVLVKVVGVDALDLDLPLERDAEVVVNHQVNKPAAIDEDDVGMGVALREINCRLLEV